MKRSVILIALSAALVTTALGLFGGCDEDKGQFIPNDPPGVRLTAHPPDSGVAGYDVEFYWEGWDSDGEVDYFIYAIDPPDMQGSADSIWTRTDANSGTFLFDATEFDTLRHWRDPQIAKSWHVFAIKAVDDMGAISEPDYLAFDAATIAPRTQFTSPPPQLGIEDYMYMPQTAGLRVTFRWAGEDPDGLVNEVPVGYLLKVTEVGDKRSSALASSVWEDTTEWVEHKGDERTAVFDFHDGHNYAVAVRAIDEAGAIEPLLLLNGNMMWIGARQSSSFPTLTVSSAAFGRRSWRGWAIDVETCQVPLGSFHELRISASSRWYGGLITGFSYGWDIPDLDSNETDPSGKGAWTPWSMTRTVIQIEFEEARDYFLHVRCKDDAGGMTLASIKFNVISLNPTKNLCFIDDWRKYPKTGERGEPLDDMVWKTMLDGYNYGEDWEDVSWDEWEVPIAESAPSLEFLSQFRVVVWSLMDNRSSAINQQSGWYSMNCPGRSNVLAVYMTSRSSTGESGKVWAYGRGLVESSILCGAVGGFYSSCDYPYPVEEGNRCGIRRATLARDFMHIDGEFDIYDRTSGGARINLYDEAWEIADYVYVDTAGPAIPKDKYTRPPAAELYPNLPFKLLHHPDVRNRGWPFYYFEVLEYPSPDQEQQHLFYDPVSEQMTGLIPLYRTHAPHPKSDANNKYCGFRYIPSKTTDPAEIVYFFFPMFPFEDSQIRATAKVVLSDWFGLPDPDALSGAVGTRR